MSCVRIQEEKSYVTEGGENTFPRAPGALLTKVSGRQQDP